MAREEGGYVYRWGYGGVREGTTWWVEVCDFIWGVVGWERAFGGALAC